MIEFILNVKIKIAIQLLCLVNISVSLVFNYYDFGVTTIV